MSVGPARPVLELEHISKSFGGTRALENIQLSIQAGEIHGLLGENGSGKSTLIKILAGYHAADTGTLRVAGTPVPLPLQPGQYRALGMAFVHQDLGLVPSLSVTDNLRVEQLANPAWRWHVSWRLERRRARQQLASYGLDIDPAARVADLSGVERSMLAIVRAVERLEAGLTVRDGGAHLLVLDEPTVFLSQDETERLFALVRGIKARGASVLFVSHDLDEALDVTDRITVLRDGRKVATVSTARTNRGELVELIVGRGLEEHAPAGRGLQRTEVVAALEGASGGTVRDLSLELRQGEVLGLTGLVGSGFEDIPYVIFGARSCEAGALVLQGHTHDLRDWSPSRAVAAGVALIPGDRHGEGSISTLPALDNVAMPVLGRFFNPLALRRGRIARHCTELMRRVDVRPLQPSLAYGSYSGGNQQKLLLAKWLQTRPVLLALYEPTQGVDVGARQEIFGLLRTVAHEGAAVVCASADHEQLAAICDRVLVLAQGAVVTELSAEGLTKERITSSVLAAGTGVS
jgi:ribose transport system ATP-binding protein